MRTIYERYLTKRIHQAFGFALFVFISLFVFFDMITQLGDLDKAGYRFHMALVYVLLLVPGHCYEITPVAALIAGIYVFSQMASQSEFTIFRVSGLSVAQALRFLLKNGLILVLFTFVIGEILTPYAEQFGEQLRLKALGATVESSFSSGVWVKDTLSNTPNNSITRFVNIGSLMPDQSIRSVRIYEFGKNFELRNILQAKQGVFVKPDHWRLTQVTQTQFSSPAQAGYIKDALQPTYQTTQKLQQEILIKSQLTPGILSVLMISPDNMGIYSLVSYINHLRENQQSTELYLIDLWKKILYPFTVWIMLALALPFAYIHTRSGTIGLKVFGGIMLGMSFQLLNTLFSHLGLLNTWPAPITVMLPSLLYGFIALGVLRWVNRN